MGILGTMVDEKTQICKSSLRKCASRIWANAVSDDLDGKDLIIEEMQNRKRRGKMWERRCKLTPKSYAISVVYRKKEGI
jgi:hypothetical protein